MHTDAVMNTIAGIGAVSASLPIAAQISVPDAEGVASNLATRGVPYILAVVCVVLCIVLYKVFGLFLRKVQEREDDLKSVLKENTSALNRMVDHCQRRAP